MLLGEKLVAFVEARRSLFRDKGEIAAILNVDEDAIELGMDLGFSERDASELVAVEMVAGIRERQAAKKRKEKGLPVDTAELGRALGLAYVGQSTVSESGMAKF